MAFPQSQLEVGFSIGSYRLVRLLGRGGMGDVWLASDLRADRLVALKLIKPHLLDTPEFRTRFLNEARTLGRLEHDRIVTLYNVVEDGGYLALVLRFIEGPTSGKGTSLADYIDERGALPMDFVLSSARDILPALGFAHDRGVIHRDIKPQNILLDRNVRSFLTDFGIAVVEFAERGTMTGSMIGTPHYMSPEQIQDSRKITVENKGHRSDIYSYGVVLFEMLTGRVPFCSDSGVEEIYKIQRAHCVEPPPPLRDVNPAISPAIEAVVLRCLAKDPDERPQTCADLLNELTAASANGTARTSAARAATVVERPRAVSEPPAAKPAVPASPKPAPAERKGGIAKAAWLGIGGVLIAGGITYGVITSRGGAATELPKQEKTSVVNPPSGGNLIPPSGGADKGSKSPGPEVFRKPEIKPSVPSGPAPAPPPLTNTLGSEKAYAQALDFLQKQMPCEGQSAIGEALKTEPSNTKYQVLAGRLKTGCDLLQAAEAEFQQANVDFEQGDYCEGKNAIDNALKKAPANQKYLALQQRLKKACALP